MKRILVMVVAMAFAFGAGAQIQKGESVASANIGLGNSVFPSMGALPPLSLEYERGVVEGLFGVDGLDLGVGGVLSYTRAKQDMSAQAAPLGLNKVGYKYSDFVVGAKASFHYDFFDLDQLDTYAAIVLGWEVASAKTYGDWGAYSEYFDNLKYSAGGFHYGISVGARWWFTEAIAANLELGYGLSYLKIGVSYKF